jgi:UrcA family protein
MPVFTKLLQSAIIGAITLGALAAMPAAASTSAEQAPTTKVLYGDLDLSTQQGQKRLQARVSAAAKRVCQFSRVPMTDLSHMRLQRDCMKTALASADVQVAQAIDETGPHTVLVAYQDRPIRH